MGWIFGKFLYLLFGLELYLLDITGVFNLYDVKDGSEEKGEWL